MANSYTDANGVYLNKLGITNAAKLRQIEYDITAYKSAEILEQGVLGRTQSYGLERQKAIHSRAYFPGDIRMGGQAPYRAFFEGDGKRHGIGLCQSRGDRSGLARA
jgi:hypothetical protein